MWVFIIFVCKREVFKLLLQSAGVDSMFGVSAGGKTKTSIEVRSYINEYKVCWQIIPASLKTCDLFEILSYLQMKTRKKGYNVPSEQMSSGMASSSQFMRETAVTGVCTEPCGWFGTNIICFHNVIRYTVIGFVVLYIIINVIIKNL